jgi:hypothetical protein
MYVFPSWADASTIADVDGQHEPSLIQALSDPARYDHRVDTVQLVETHISWVLLAGEYAYKIKKPVTLPFVDFSALERRKRFCDEELRLNRRLAPSLYLDVVPIGGSASQPILGQEPAIEYAVKMQRFEADARVDYRLARGAVTVEDLHELARAIAEFHGSLERAPADSRLGSPAIVIRNTLTNLRELELTVSDAHLDAVTGLRDWTESRCIRLEDAFASRKRSGFIREGHGDLHLENLVYIDGRITAFDALEFEPELRWMDVMSEAAFVVMDLMAHERSDLAHEFLNRYLEITGDYGGLEVLRFYLVHRALVRAKVAAIRRQQLGSSESDGIPYLEHAAQMTARGKIPLLLITHGLSGSGKTFVTDRLVGGLQAIRIRSDLERKRLHGFAPDADTGSRVGEGLYGGAASSETYAALARYAAFGLKTHWNMIIDAAFLRRAERDMFRELAERVGARFVVLDCAAPEPTLRERVAARRHRHRDASEATADVLDYQLRRVEPLGSDEQELAVRIDTSRSVVQSALLSRVARRAA